MLEIVNGSAIDGGSMIASEEWINLPVGHNLVDHVNVKHPELTIGFQNLAADTCVDRYRRHPSRRRFLRLLRGIRRADPRG